MTDFKKGGPLQNSNIYATNRLFVKNPLFKKKKKKRAPGVYNPKAKFKYEDGGEQGCPPGQQWNPYTKRCEPKLEDRTFLNLMRDRKYGALQQFKLAPKSSYNPKYIQNLKEVTITASKKAKAKKNKKKTDTFSSDYEKLVEQYDKLKNSPLLANQEQANNLLNQIKDIELYNPGSTRKNLYRGERLEDQINNLLDKAQDKASISANAITEDGNDEIDNFRHPQAGRYAAEAIVNYFPEWAQYTGIPQIAGFLGANAMGVAHEIGTLPYDERSWSTKLAESGEDIFNNAVGAGVGVLPMSSRDKTNTLLELSKQNMLPDGIVDENPANNLYLKKGPNDPGKFKSPYKQELGGSIMDLTEEEIQKYIDGGYVVEEVNDPSIPALTKAAKGGASKGCKDGEYWDGTKCTKLITLKNDKKYIDGVANWAMHVSDPNKISSDYNDQIKDRLYSGKWGFDPQTGALVKLSAVQPKSVTTVDAKTKASREKEKLAEKNYRAEEENKKAYEQSIIGAGFDPATFGKAKGINTITGEPIYASSKEEADRINQEAINQAAIEGHAAVVNNPVFKTAANFTPVGMAVGAIEGLARFIPDAYTLAQNPSWAAAGQLGMDALQAAPVIGKPLATATGKAFDYVNPYVGNKAYSLANKGSKNLDIDATPNIEFQGAQTFDYGDVPEVLSGLRQRGQNLDELGVKGSELLHPDMINYHGTYAGRPIVEVKMPDGSSEMFYKSSGWAGKQGAGTDGTTAGMWQVYGGHSKSPSADNWFIKDYGYTDYYGSNTYKEMAENLNNALSKKYGFENTDELDAAFNFKNKQGAVDTYIPSANDPSSTAFYKSKNTGTNTSTGLTDADIAAARAEEEAWLTSDEYLKRRMKNTGESAKAVREDVAKILKRADKANYNVNADLKGAHGEMATNIFINPKVSVSKTAPNPNKVLRHENIHLYSPASAKKTLFSKDLHKNWDKPNVAELKASERGVYANYPTIGDSPESIMYTDPSDYNYNMLGYEQQARHLGAMRDIAAKNNVDIKAGKKLTEQQVRSHIDDFIKNRENVDYDYDEIWGAEILNERKKLADAYGAPLDEIKKIDPDKYKEIINVSKDNAAKRITKVLNNAWVVAPTVGIAGTATMLANPFQGSNGLQQQKKGGATDDYIEVDIPEKEIQWYIDNGYRVEPVTKLKKFIG